MRRRGWKRRWGVPACLAAAVLAAGSGTLPLRPALSGDLRLEELWRQGAVAGFGFLWKGHYPGGREWPETASSLELLLNAVPAYRLGRNRQEAEKAGAGRDPSFAAYLENRSLHGEKETDGAQKGTGAGETGGTEKGAGTDAGAAGESGTDGASAEAEAVSAAGLSPGGQIYSMDQLADYDFLMRTFYNVHPSTTAGREEMDAGRLLSLDMRLEGEEGGPQILIYHSHSQETYADYGPENRNATVVGVGAYLAELLREKGYEVIHDTTVYDLRDGTLDRSRAYTYALEGITGILQENPSVEVVLDLHRDGVDEDVRLVSEINGKTTASVMFFNGMSQTPDGPIEYLPNPYLEENLAFSLQMQMKAAAYFPGLTRKIYLKGLRYNLHVRPRSSLVEVGAQNNTFEEAKNAMEPLAEVLDMVLQGN